MKNCLIIKGADFSNNAIEQVVTVGSWAYNFTVAQWESAAELTLADNKNWPLVTTPFIGRTVVAVKIPSTLTGSITINGTAYQVSAGMNTIVLNAPITISAETTISVNVSARGISGCNTSSIGPATQELPTYSVAIDFGFE